MCTALKAGRKCCCRRSSTSRGTGKEVAFRADAAFTKPEIYEALEERGVKYTIRSYFRTPQFLTPAAERAATRRDGTALPAQSLNA
jgi:hypothetical protein